MLPIRTYEVCVQGFPGVKYSARSPAKARVRAWHDYRSYDNYCTFKRFLKVSTVRRCEAPPGIGERILVCGKPATRVIGSGNANYFMYDDSDHVMTAHDLEITPHHTGR